MKKSIGILCFLILIFFPNTLIYSQRSVSTAGGEARASTGSVSYTIGQIASDIYSGTGGSIIQGVQQPYEISAVTALEHIYETKLTVYPNPTSGNVKLIFDSFENQEMRYQLYDISGILLQNNKIESRETEILMEKLQASMYILKVTIDNKEVKVFKIIKN